jgi:hypothetical protein
MSLNLVEELSASFNAVFFTHLPDLFVISYLGIPISYLNIYRLTVNCLLCGSQSSSTLEGVIESVDSRTTVNRPRLALSPGLGVYLAAPLLIGFDDVPLDITFYLLSYYSNVYHLSTFSWENENQGCPIISIVSDAMN